MTDQASVKEKSPPSVRRHSALAPSVPIALIALGIALVALVGGCGADETETAREAPVDSSKRVILTLRVRNETQQRPAQGLTVQVPEGQPWRPDLSWGSAGKAFGAYRVGRPHVFYVAVDSSSGRRIEVPFEMKPDMISGFASSITRLTVYDDSLVARGPAVPGRHLNFER